MTKNDIEKIDEEDLDDAFNVIEHYLFDNASEEDYISLTDKLEELKIQIKELKK